MDDNEQIIFEHAQSVTRFIATRIFDKLTDKSVLELGPFYGGFTEHILARTNKQVTCIENNPEACEVLQGKFSDIINLVKGDFHYAIREQTHHDAAVIFGVLYHSPAPLMILEDIVNFVNPDTILLEAWGQIIPITIDPEPLNVPGYLFPSKKSSGFSISIADNIYSDALKNMGYNLESRFEINQHLNLSLGDFKHNGVYMVFKRMNQSWL